MRIQVETVTLQNGSRMDVIRDVAAVRRMADQWEQLQVQLAGCATAAGYGGENIARKGDYGWSPAYQDVLDLRVKFDENRATCAEAVKLLWGVHQWFMEQAPERYNGCGLWIDVDAFLKEQAAA